MSSTFEDRWVGNEHRMGVRATLYWMFTASSAPSSSMHIKFRSGSNVLGIYLDCGPENAQFSFSVE